MPAPFQLVAAPHTPFHADGSLNLDLIAQQSALFARNGIDGVFEAGVVVVGDADELGQRGRRDQPALLALAIGPCVFRVGVPDVGVGGDEQDRQRGMFLARETTVPDERWTWDECGSVIPSCA